MFRLRLLGFPICHALPHAFEYFGEEVRCAEPFFAVLAALGRTDLDWEYLIRRARQFGARRVLSLLVYGQSNDIAVPTHVIRELFSAIYEE